jgi:hypothetical protein
MNMNRVARTGRRLLLAAGFAAVCLLPTAPAASAAPPSLSGEFFAAGSTSGNGGTLITTVTCNQTSPSTIAFTASGTIPAGDPYPGSFTESGFVTISTTPSGTYVDGVPLFAVSSVETFFTISSPVGEVSGTKHLAESGVYGLCDEYNDQPFGNTGANVTGYFRLLNPGGDGFGESYDAIITVSGSSFEDTGISGLLFDDLNVAPTPLPVQDSNVLNEAFRSNGVIAVSTVGHATGGGQLSPNGNPVAFGFEAKSENGQLKGQCDVVDQSAGVKVHCSDATAFVEVSATEVKFFGDATVNGLATTYEIDAQDLADSGIGSDTFAISTATGYGASGTITAGNVQIH